jgi:hypothetical protein
LVVVGDGDDEVLGLVLLEDWDEVDGEDGVELEELGTVDDVSGDGSGVADGCVGVEGDEDGGGEEGSDVSNEEVGETGEVDSPCGMGVGETAGLETGGELLERPWRLCSQRRFSSTS